MHDSSHFVDANPHALLLRLLLASLVPHAPDLHRFEYSEVDQLKALLLEFGNLSVSPSVCDHVGKNVVGLEVI